MAKKIISFVSAAFILCAVFAFFVYAVESKPGDTAQSVVSISDNTGVAYIKIRVSYDSSIMTLTSADDTGFLKGYMPGQSVSNNPFVATWSNTTNNDGDGDILTLTFEVNKGTEDGEYPVSIEIVDINDQSEHDVSINVSASSVIVKHEHKWDSGAVTKNPTCEEPGEKTFTCSVCGEVIKAQEEIPALGHKEVKVEGKPATCTEKGLSDGIKCSVCGETIKSQEELPARGHSFKDGVCTECGAIDPDYKLILKKGSKLILDSDKKFIYVKPEKISGVTASEFKSEIESDITLSIADSDVVVNGLKFKFGVNEYTVIVIGDTSPDGKITAKDARTVLRIAARLDSPDPVTKEAADIDSDGKISSREARSILRFAARLQTKIDD